MKYDFKVVGLILILFFTAQIIGLYVVNHYLSNELPYNIERPQFEEQTSYIPVTIMILVATGIAILLLRFKAFRLWKFWFFIGITFALLISFSVFIPSIIALILALVISFFKVFKPNYIIHNLAEVFMYGGLAAIFVPVFSLSSIFILLLIISTYDMIAVWKTKHMVKLAKSQAKMKIFAGLLIPYKNKSAILGGGDIGFPLFFVGTILKTYSALNAVIVILFITLSLFLLLYYAQKNKFYPAMPFLSAGCLAGYLVSLLL